MFRLRFFQNVNDVLGQHRGIENLSFNKCESWALLGPSTKAVDRARNFVMAGTTSWSMTHVKHKFEPGFITLQNVLATDAVK